MPKYLIEQYELHIETYEVEADSRAEAILKLFAQEAEPIGIGPGYIETAEEYGMSTELDPELAEELRQRGVDVEDGYIPTIRRVLKLKPDGSAAPCDE